MRVEWLFLRWLVVIGLIALAATYAQSWRESRLPSGYETIPLVHGARSSGLPVRGVMVDPEARNIYAVVGGPTGSNHPGDFFILWKGQNGETFSASFPKGGNGAAELSEMSADGQLRQLHRFEASDSVGVAEATDARQANAAAALHAIATNLSASADGSGE